MEKLQMTLRDFQQRGFYKGVVRSLGKRVKISLLISEPMQVRDLIPGDIYLKAPIKYAGSYSESGDYDEYHAVIDDRPKIVRVFRIKADQKERLMQVCPSPLCQRILSESLAAISKRSGSKTLFEVP